MGATPVQRRAIIALRHRPAPLKPGRSALTRKPRSRPMQPLRWADRCRSARSERRVAEPGGGQRAIALVRRAAVDDEPLPGSATLLVRAIGSLDRGRVTRASDWWFTPDLGARNLGPGWRSKEGLVAVSGAGGREARPFRRRHRRGDVTVAPAIGEALQERGFLGRRRRAVRDHERAATTVFGL